MGVRRGRPCCSGWAGKVPGASARGPFRRPWRRSRGLKPLRRLFSLRCCQKRPKGSIQNPAHLQSTPPGISPLAATRVALGSSSQTSPGDASSVCSAWDGTSGERGSSGSRGSPGQRLISPTRPVRGRVGRAGLQGKGLSPGVGDFTVTKG